MGRVKELYINIVNANNGELPEGLTWPDILHMKELETYEWQEYERKKNEISSAQKKEIEPEEFTIEADKTDDKEDLPF